MKRSTVAALAVMVAAVVPGRLAAQEEDLQHQTYRERRAQLVKELEETQRQLGEVRGQRVQLQARVESVIAQILQQLDAILTASQDNLMAQRDRFTSIGEAVTRRAGSVLVVLLRADSSQSQSVASASLSVDNTAAEPRTYSVTANSALQMGAVDQLYRANVLPTAHTVTLQATVNGQPITQTVNVNAAGESVTYVQFAIRNGQIVPTTWTSRGTTPF